MYTCPKRKDEVSNKPRNDGKFRGSRHMLVAEPHRSHACEAIRSSYSKSILKGILQPRHQNSTVLNFPHPSSSKSHTPYQLPAAGPTCHTLLSPSLPTPPTLSLPLVTPPTSSPHDQLPPHDLRRCRPPEAELPPFAWRRPLPPFTPAFRRRRWSSQVGSSPGAAACGPARQLVWGGADTLPLPRCRPARTLPLPLRQR
jgi:hypothetical protein